MTNPNPSPELLPCPFCGSAGKHHKNDLYEFIQCSNDECAMCPSTNWRIIEKGDALPAWNTRALTPPTPAETVTVALPGAGEVEQRARKVLADTRIAAGSLFGDCPDEVAISAMLSFATVAAANDEGVALEAALSAMGWADERMIADARKIAGGFWFETYGYGGNCCLTVPQVASLRSCLDGARAAIRLLSQGEGK